MSLTDPELDLLLEMLEDDPSDPAFPHVGEELVRRARWSDAARVLGRGMASPTGPATDDRGHALDLLARSLLELGRYDEALGALASLPRDPRSEPERCRVEILALERAGRFDQARAGAARFLEHDPNDVVVSSVFERLEAPPPASDLRAADPFLTVERAEHYVRVGRADRAVRVYRRILLQNPDHPAVALRMRQLLTAPADVEDDLSAELTDPGLVPEKPEPLDVTPGPLTMPAPSVSTPVSIERTTRPPAPDPVSLRPAPLPGLDVMRPLEPPDPMDAETDRGTPERLLTPKPAAPAPWVPPAPDQATMELPPLSEELREGPDEEEDPTQRIDVMALLKQYATSPAYEEEDTILDLTVVREDDVTPPRAERDPPEGGDPSDAPLPTASGPGGPVDPRKRTVRR